MVALIPSPAWQPGSRPSPVALMQTEAVENVADDQAESPVALCMALHRPIMAPHLAPTDPVRIVVELGTFGSMPTEASVPPAS